MNYEPNTIDWWVGDLVIHDADEKSERMVMRVVETGLPLGLIKTEYLDDDLRLGGKPRYYLNRKEVLHNPGRFDI